MTEVVRVELGERSYDILVGSGLLPQTGATIADRLGRRTVHLVTDETVAGLYLEDVRRSCEAAGLRCHAHVLPPGEATKDFGHLQRLCEAVLEAGIDRRGLLLALGGGVVGDLVGLTAALLLRGVDFVQVPTTLLAQVDSSVGGKTAIDVPQGKNLIGAFHQPRLVIADTTALASLPPRELRAGYAEVVKYGAIDDPAFFAWLERHGKALLDGDQTLLAQAVARSCRAKARIVAADERESGPRALLNLGHTFGHALEAEVGYDGSLLHGEAVALGMVLAFDLSARLGLCPAADGIRLAAVLAAGGLPTSIADLPARRWDPASLVAWMRRDKKARDGSLTLVLARGLGRAFVDHDAPVQAVTETLQASIACRSADKLAPAT